MSSVESRILTMKFDNVQFQRQASDTLSMLDKLKQSLNFGNIAGGATKGLGLVSGLLGKFGVRNPFESAQKGVSDLQAAANGFDTGAITGGVTGISKSFLAMSTIAITALSNITNKAIDAGLQMAKSLTISPVKQGFDEYELKMGSIQTMLANTERYGTTLTQVTAALDELNEYADKTIYNFGDMTKNIGLFTNAGIRVEDATSMIKGFSNVAAASGTSSQGAASAAYQLSQALSSGTIRLMDWRSLTNVGMGNKNMQNGLIEIADAMGTLEQNSTSATEVQSNFNASLEKNWLSADVMSAYLKIMAGEMTAAEQASLGLTDAQIAGFSKAQQTAEDAATKVRTLTGLVGTLREGVGSAWAQTFDILIGDFNEASEMWTNVSEKLGGMFAKTGEARNALLQSWKDLGGRDALIEGISNAFNALLDILGPIKQAFRDIFPPMTAQRLFDLTVKFRDFAESMRIGEETSNNLRRTFRGVFAIFSIIGQFIGAAIGMFVDLFGTIGKGSGGFLSFTGGIGDFLVALDEAIRQSDIFKSFFSGLAAVLKIPLKILGAIGEVIGKLFTGFDDESAGKIGDAFENVENKMEPLSAVADSVRTAFQKMVDFLETAVDKVGDLFGGIGEAIANSITPDNFGTALDVINTGLLGGIVLLLKNFMSDGLTVNVGDGLFGSIKESFGAVTETMKSMQANIKADVIMKIAGALAILTASIFVLSTIDSAKLTKAMVGIGVGFGILQGALIALNTAMNTIGAAKLPFIAAGLIGLALAMLIFAGAIRTLAGLELFEIARGLAGIAGVMFILTKSVEVLSKNASGMVRVGVSLILIAIALKIMASAIEDFAEFSWAEMAQGLVGVASALGILAAAMKIMPKNIFVQSAALVVLGGALKVIASAVSDFANIGLENVAKGLGSIAATLGIMAIALRLLPANMLIQATALVILGGALNVIGMAVAQMGGMSMEQIAKGLVTLAGSLIILAGGLYLMTGSIVGAAALVVAAGALALLVPVLIALGAMTWTGIIQGLTMLAGVFVIIGAAGYLLAPVVPVIFAFSASLLLLGAGLALAGAGALAFATAFAIVVAAGGAGVAVLAGILDTIIQSIPKALGAFGQGIVEFAKAIAKGGPAFFKAFQAILTSMLKAVIAVTPLIGRAFTVLLNTALRIIVNAVPRIADAGLRVITGFLRAINNNIGKIVPLAISIVTKFINGIANNIGKVIQAGANLIIKFVNGVANAIRNNSSEMGRAGGNLATAIIEGMVKGLASGVGVVASKAKSVAKSALSSAMNFLGIKSPSKEFFKVGMWSSLGMAEGLDAYSRAAERSAAGVAHAALDTISVTMSKIGDAVSTDIDMSPVITPILDLTRLQQEATKIGASLGSPTISTDLSYDRASSISSDRLAATMRNDEAQSMTEPREITLTQINNSPEPLAPSVIYRQTKSLIKLTKEALDS